MANLNDTPSGDRVHIGFFGVRNAGKSSVVNAVTGQDLAVVSDTLGTTTDPVRKAMELLPLGPVVIIDTPGIDDAGDLGEERVRRARQVLRRCDIAVLVVDATRGATAADRELAGLFAKRQIPFVVALNKADLMPDGWAPAESAESSAAPAAPAVGLDTAFATLAVSALDASGINQLKETLAHAVREGDARKRLVGDLIAEGDTVVLVVPIDESAPKGRIILPQQMVLRDVLDAHASALCCQPEQLAALLGGLGSAPRLVITDSQAFAQVAAIVPEQVPLTSFSILMARYKGSLQPFADGAAALSRLTDESRVLVSEGCTHHRQCKDIGTVKIPGLIRAYCGAQPEFTFTSGGDFPDELSPFSLVVHCGGCMLNEREMAYRIASAQDAGVPIVNYGMAIAQMNGILARSLQPLL